MVLMLVEVDGDDGVLVLVLCRAVAVTQARPTTRPPK